MTTIKYKLLLIDYNETYDMWRVDIENFSLEMILKNY